MKAENVHSLGSLDIELPGSQKPQQSQGIQSLGVAQLLELSTELNHRSILLGSCVSRVAGHGIWRLVGLGLWSDCWVIIVVILGLRSGHGGGGGNGSGI